jgi:hypothetical protein
VVKSAPGYTKGAKVFEASEVKRLEEAGGKFRPILCYCKDTNKALKPLAKALAIPCEWQHGFMPQKGVLTAAGAIEYEEGLFGKSKVFIDLKDAFNQITLEQVREMFHLVFFLNKTDSDWLARRMCHTGFLFQGNPVAPLIFNILSRFIGLNVHKQTKGAVKLVQYADDLTFIVNRDYVPQRYIRWLYKLIRWAGWTPNEAKTEVQKSHNNWGCLGLRRFRNGYIARKQRNIKAKIRFFHHLIVKRHITTTRRLNKIGEPIGADAMVKGLAAWLMGIHQHLPASPLLNNYMSPLYIMLDRVSIVCEVLDLRNQGIDFSEDKLNNLLLEAGCATI